MQESYRWIFFLPLYLVEMFSLSSKCELSESCELHESSSPLAIGETPLSMYSVPLLSLLNLEAEKDNVENDCLIGRGQSLTVGRE